MMKTTRRLRISRSGWTGLIVLALAVWLPAPGRTATPAGPTAPTAAEGWAHVPAILARIIPPRFPDRVFDITAYGAVGDGLTDCTAAFRRAIAACHAAGGGRVVVPPGTFRTGAIHLRSGVNLQVTRGATIRFSTDPQHFLPVVFTRYESTEVMNYSPFVYALDQENIALTGEGTLDGQAARAGWHAWKGSDDGKRLTALADRGVPVAERVFGAAGKLRPNFVQFVRCRNVLIEGIRLVDSPMWVLNPVLCTNVTVRGVRIDVKGVGAKAPNTDGCNPECSTDVLIEDCVFNCDDDCIAVKAGRDTDGRRVNVPSQNIVIRRCQFRAGHGGVTAGSETAGGIRNLFAEECHFDSPDLRMALRLKTNARRGGFIENYFIRHCTVQSADTGIHLTMRYENVTSGPAVPFIRHVDIRHVTFAKLNRALFIEGLSPEAPITDVTIAHCTFPETPKPNLITNAVRVRLLNADAPATR